MKVLVLVHADLVPPEKIKSKSEWEGALWNTEYDVVSSLKKSGHNVLCLGVNDDLKPIKEALETFKPRIVFNLLEEFAGEALFDQNVVSYLQMQGVNYTGNSPRGLILARDKALAKKVLTYHRIPTPAFYVFPRKKKVSIAKKINYPLFVKSLYEEASYGITKDSIVKDADQLKERIEHFHKVHEADVIAESFVAGREFYVGVLGNDRLQVLPIVELQFNKVNDGHPRVATSKVKWDIKYRKKYGIKTEVAKGLSPELEKRMIKVCKRTYRALKLSGYVRIDLRVTEAEEIFVIEANPNPDVGYQEEMSDAALSAGMEYDQLISKILKLGLSRPPVGTR